MFEKLWEIIKEKDNLLDQSKSQAIRMLEDCREMFEIVSKAVKNRVSEDIRSQIRRMDREINKRERGVRKMVFEHLSISTSADLLTGLQLLNMVIDIERIGDYTKNIADTVDMVPGQYDFGEYSEVILSIEETTNIIFDKTIRAIRENDAEQARAALDLYEALAKKCDRTIKELVTSKTDEKMVEKKYLAMVLLLRYLKRVNAHLKNISSTIVNPFHKIGYRV